MRRRRGYKIVYREKTGLFSAIETLAAVEYKVRMKTVPRPNCGPLCVFSRKKAAMQFAKMHGYLRVVVFRCSYLSSIHQYVWNSHGDKRRIMELPDYTVLADEVILLEEL